MNVTRTAAFVLAGGALAAMIAGATTAGRRPITIPAPTRPSAAELKGEQLAVEIARLRERLRPTTSPSTARNLFRFGAAGRAAEPRRTATDPPPSIVTPPPVVAPPARLVGLAEDPSDSGPVRTAIISAFGDVFLVKPGDTVTTRFRVVDVSGEGVTLVDLTDGSTIRLVLP
jgi:hypothetical protein